MRARVTSTRRESSAVACRAAAAHSPRTWRTARGSCRCFITCGKVSRPDSRGASRCCSAARRAWRISPTSKNWWTWGWWHFLLRCRRRSPTCLPCVPGCAAWDACTSEQGIGDGTFCIGASFSKSLSDTDLSSLAHQSHERAEDRFLVSPRGEAERSREARARQPPLLTHKVGGGGWARPPVPVVQNHPLHRTQGRRGRFPVPKVRLSPCGRSILRAGIPCSHPDITRLQARGLVGYNPAVAGKSACAGIAQISRKAIDVRVRAGFALGKCPKGA